MRSFMPWLLGVALVGALAGSASTQVAFQWVPYDGHYYLLTPQCTWSEAEAFAVAYGGHLAAIDDADENAFLFSVFDVCSLPGGAVYIGLNDIDMEGSFVWSDGQTPVGFTAWVGGEPNDSPGFPTNCQAGEDAAMLGYGCQPLWWDAPICYTTHHAIIEVDFDPTWHGFNGRSYRLSGRMPWAAVEGLAVSEGGHLMTVNDAAEGDAVFALLGVASLPSAYIGFNDIAVEGVFEWSSGEPVTYTNWQAGEPNDSPGFPTNCQNGEDAALMGWGGTPTWWDGPVCYTTYHGLIELGYDPAIWQDLGNGLHGTAGFPRLNGTGSLQAGDTIAISAKRCASSAPAFLVIGLGVASVPLKGGTLVPDPQVVVSGLAAGGGGSLALAAPMPSGVPAGTSIVMQLWLQDAAGVAGYAATNAISGTTP